MGAGTSPLVGRLLDEGYRDIEVVDISVRALERLRTAVGERADHVVFHHGDVREVILGRPVAVWHDRAVFHFLTEAEDRRAYAVRAAEGVRPGGHVVIATFSPAGPDRCSGLPVQRHDAASLEAELGPAFELVEAVDHVHVTPWGAPQPFVHATLRRRGSTA